MLRLIVCVFLAVSVFLVASVQAAPLSVRIGDHDFAFDVARNATYDYAGVSADHLSVHEPNGHYAGQYTYIGDGNMPTVLGPGAPPASGYPYPLYSGSPLKFAANLELDMFFDTNDGAYTNPGGDSFAVSLTGMVGTLKITGRVASQDFIPVLYPTVDGNDITLLEIVFSKTSLLARTGTTTADLVEGLGTVKMLLGVDVSNNPQLNQGSTFFKFIAPTGKILFPSSPTALYDPLAYTAVAVTGARISGEAGVVPEPASMAVLALGGIGILLRRRQGLSR